MRKIFLLLALIFLLPMRICSANTVPVSDLNVYKFIEICNVFFESTKINREIKLDMVQNQGNFVLYFCSNYPDVIILFANQAGTVSKIMITSRTDIDNMYGTLSLLPCLAVIGLSPEEAAEIIRDPSKNSSVWCTSTKRRIILQLYEKVGNGIGMMLKANDVYYGDDEIN